MPGPIRLRQSSYFDRFRCIGTACEDNCCGDWGISIDRETYEKYQVCTDPDLRPALQQFITIGNAKGSQEDFARIALVNHRCPFLDEGLCGIQRKLGESFLSNTCASYPRAIAVIDGIVERSLHVSCPEAARLVLLNQGPFDWKEQTSVAVPLHGARVLDSARANRSGVAYPGFQEVRQLFLEVLDTKTYLRWQRVAILAHLTEELNAILNAGSANEMEKFIQRSFDQLHFMGFDVPKAPEPRPLLPIETILELVVARIGSEFVTRRFLECYRDFMQGVGWGPQSTLDQIQRCHTQARLQFYEPFMTRHEYLLDNFLLNYAIGTMLPYGRREDQKICIDFVENEVQRQFLLFAVHYAAVRSLLIGIAAFHQSGFGLEHVVKLVQSYSKSFQHSTSYPGKAIQILAANGIHTASQATVLFQE